MSNDPTTPTNPVPDSGIGMILAGGIVFFGVWLAYDGTTTYLVPAYRADHVYAETTGTVVDAQLDARRGDKGAELFDPKVRVRYEAGGRALEEWCRLDWSESYGGRERAEADLRGFPVGGTVPVWYDPDLPTRVVVTRGAGYALGWVMVGFGLAIPGFFIGLPIVMGTVIAAQAWLRYEQTTGRVTGGEVREVPSGEDTLFRPTLLVEYDRGATAWRGTIPGDTHTERATAEAALETLLSAHPVGEQRAMWYDPGDRLDPTFEPVTLVNYVIGCGLIAAWPVVAVVTGVVQFGRWVGWLLTRRPGPAADVPAWRRVLMVVAAVATLALTVRYVFKQDYEVYFVMEPVMGKVVEAAADPIANTPYYHPRISFGYTVGNMYYARSTVPGWDGVRLSRQGKEEAEAKIAAYPVGKDVLVWYNPNEPLRAILRRYGRWHLYPVLIPPLWVIVTQLRRLFRGAAATAPRG